MIFPLLIVMLAGVAGSALGQNLGQYWPPVVFCEMAYAGAGYPPPSTVGAMSCTCSFQPLRVTATDRDIQPTGSIPVYQGWWAYLPEPVEPGGWLEAQSDVSLDSGSSEVISANPSEPPLTEQSDIRQPINAKIDPSRESSGHQASDPIGADPARQGAKGSKPTIYLIALKDHSIVQAIGLWEEGSVLYYVSIEYALNQISDGRIDWPQSERLNSERGVELKVAIAN